MASETAKKIWARILPIIDRAGQFSRDSNGKKFLEFSDIASLASGDVKLTAEVIREAIDAELRAEREAAEKMAQVIRGLRGYRDDAREALEAYESARKAHYG